jgi:hypothetical protein
LKKENKYSSWNLKIFLICNTLIALRRILVVPFDFESNGTAAPKSVYLPKVTY